MDTIGRKRGGGAGPVAQVSGMNDASRFDFHVDKATEGLIAGWVADKADRSASVTLEFAVDGVPLGIARADQARVDVEAAGRGPRHCGFTWHVPSAVSKIAMETGEPLDILVIDGAHKAPLTRVSLKSAFGISGLVRNAMLPALDRAMNESAVAALDDAGPVERFELGRYRAHERLLFAAEPTTADGRAALSPFLAFTRTRLRQEDTLPLDGSETARDAYVRWYIEAYGTQRAPLRAPLGAAEIATCNAPVPLPGVGFKVSRLSLAMALTQGDAARLFPLTDLGRYEEFVVWWATLMAPHLHVEDCLVPDYYVETLRRVPAEYQERQFALSVYMLRRACEPRFSVLDLKSEQDRVLFHVWLLLESVDVPGLIRFLPPKNLSALFEGAAGATLFDRIVRTLHPSGEAFGEVFGAAVYSDLLWRRGFDLNRRRFLFTDAAGNRFEAARWPPARARREAPVDLQVIGPFQKSSGLGQATRLSAETLRHARIPARFVDFGLDNPAPVGMSSRSDATDQPVRARVNLIHLNGETVPQALAYMPDVFDGAYNIGYFFWELSRPAAAQRLALGFLDEIWVATDYGVSIYEPVVDVPVRNVGMAVEPVPDPGRAAGRAFLSERLPVGPDTFVFLATFDSFSFLERKNPHGLVEAFRAAFGPEEDVLLVLKTHNRDFVNDRHQVMRWEWIAETAAADRRITVLNETMRFSDLMKLKKGVDCYVSLHRSEGWGFGLIEAMSIGTPVLCTAYSGNMDFTKADNAWLVDYDLVKPRPNEYIFVDDDPVWAEPRLASAVEQLRAVREDEALRTRKAEAARRFVAQNFSLDAQARKYRARLGEIMASLA